MREVLNVVLCSRAEVVAWWGAGRVKGGLRWAGLATVVLGACVLFVASGPSYADDAPASGGSAGSNFCVDDGDEIP